MSAKKSKKQLKKGAADSFLQKQAREKAAVGASKRRLGLGGNIHTESSSPAPSLEEPPKGPIAAENVEHAEDKLGTQELSTPLPEEKVEPQAPALPAEREESGFLSFLETEKTGPESDGDRLRGGLMDHLRDLRRTLVIMIACAFVGFCVCFCFVEPILDILTAPLLAVLPAGSHAMYTTLPEPFFMRMFVSLVAGVFLMSPAIFYAIWSFISPGLYENERKFIVPVALISAIFFVGGALFCFKIVFPFAFQFFMSFATEQIQSVPKMSDYIDFVIKLLLAFGLIFEMPIFAFFLSRMGVVTATMMRNVRPYAVVMVFIVAAILTPPDVVSQLLMAFPMLILYEVSILVAAIFGKKKKEEDGEEEQEKASV